MTRLTEMEKTEMLRLRKQGASPPPALRRQSARSYIEFATFASRFNRAAKPVRFEGKCWRL